MKKYAESRVLLPAPRKLFALRTAAFMACAGLTFLATGRDASAVPGIPLFPTFDLIQPARLDASPAPAVLGAQQSQLANQVGNLIQFQYPAPQPPAARPQSQGQANAPVWNGFGPLPGAFQAPWSMPDSNFDPSFHTSYWSPTGGYKNTADAPWNYGITGQSRLSAAIFDRMVAYAGKGISHSPQPIWNPTDAPALAEAAL